MTSSRVGRWALGVAALILAASPAAAAGAMSLRAAQPVGPPLAGPAGGAPPQPLEALARTLAQVPPGQEAALTVELVLLPKPRLEPAPSSEEAPAARGPGALGLRREYRLPPASAEARAEELRGALDELRRTLERADPASDVRLRLSLSLSPPPPAAFARDSSLADYLSRVRALIERQKRYPSIARQLRLEGRVLLRTSIGADGALLDASVVGSAGGHLDKAALLAVRRAGPFPSPVELGLDSVDVEVPIAYVLE